MKGVWSDSSLAKRSAAARKGAATRKRRAGALTAEQQRVRAERKALRRFLDGKGPPLSAPEPGGAADRVMTGPQISELIDRIRATVEQR